MTEIRRREALKVLAGGALTATGLPTEAQPQANGISGLLSQFNFTGQDGNPVSARSLGSSLRGKNIALSFTWAGCAVTHKTMHEALSGIETEDRNLVHVVIDVIPDLDNLAQHQRDNLVQELRETGNMKNRIVLLYPKAQDLPKIQAAVGLIPNPVPQDIVSIGLYGRNGNRLDFKSTAQRSPQSIIDAWKGLINSGVQR